MALLLNLASPTPYNYNLNSARTLGDCWDGSSVHLCCIFQGNLIACHICRLIVLTYMMITMIPMFEFEIPCTWFSFECRYVEFFFDYSLNWMLLFWTSNVARKAISLFCMWLLCRYMSCIVCLDFFYASMFK